MYIDVRIFIHIYVEKFLISISEKFDAAKTTKWSSGLEFNFQKRFFFSKYE